MSWPAFWAVVFWGLSFIATKTALREIDPFTLLALRFGIGAFLLLVAEYHQDRGFLKAFSFKDWITIFILAILGVSGHILIQAYGLLYTSAVNTGWIIAIYPIVIALAARVFLREPMTGRKIIGIVLGFVGVSLIISRGQFSLALFQVPSSFGDLLILSSALTWAAFTVWGRGFLSRFPPLKAITPIMVAGFLTILPFSRLMREGSLVFHLSLETWIGVLFLGILCSGAAYLLWYSALEKEDSSIVGMYLYLEPFVTLIGAYFFLGEAIHGMTLLGGGMTLFGVYLTTWKSSRSKG